MTDIYHVTFTHEDMSFLDIAGKSIDNCASLDHPKVVPPPPPCGSETRVGARGGHVFGTCFRYNIRHGYDRAFKLLPFDFS